MASWNGGQEVPRTQVGASCSGCPLSLLIHTQGLWTHFLYSILPSLFFIKQREVFGVVVYNCNPSTLESEAGGWL